jgi:hypothetical protein
MNRLALDLGTRCGWAAMIEGVRTGGTWRLASEKQLKNAREEEFDRRCDPRFLQLLKHLSEWPARLDQIAFEDVLFSKYTLQTQLWSALRSAVWAYHFVHPETDIQCLDTTRLKVWGAQHGGATKEMMGAWLVKKHPARYLKNPEPIPTCFVRERGTDRMIDDNQVDAQHLLDYAIHNF